MSSTYSDQLRLELQGTGDNDGTWGAKLVTTFEMVEAAISGRVEVTHDDTANYTLTTANGTDDEARHMILNIGGSLSAPRNAVVPTKSKVYVVKNATTGGYAVTVKTSGGTGISVPNGVVMFLMCDGTNVVEAVSIAVSAVTGLGTGVATALAVNVGSVGAPVVLNGALGTPSSGTLTSCTGLPISTGVSGLGANIATALGVAVGSAGAPVIVNGVLGTPSSGNLANCTFPTLNQNTTGSSASCTGNAATVTNGVYTTGAGTVFLAPNGSAANLTSFPTLNQNTTGTASNITAYTINQNVGTGNSPSFVDVTITSDEALKFGWQPFGSDLLKRFAKVKRGIYRRRDIAMKQAGVSAQSFREVLPEGVVEKDGKLHISQSATLAILAELTDQHEQMRLRHNLAIIAGLVIGFCLTLLPWILK